MSYILTDPQPPGLQPMETALTLANGVVVAVSVTSDRPLNNTGVVFTAIARCIDENGETLICNAGTPIETCITHSSSADEITNLTEAGIKKEMLLAVLGEPLTTDETEPLINWSAEYLYSASICTAKTCADATATNNQSAATILGL